MFRDPDLLRLNPWLEDGAGELTVLSAFCIFVSLSKEGGSVKVRRLRCRRSTSPVIALQFRSGRARNFSLKEQSALVHMDLYLALVYSCFFYNSPRSFNLSLQLYFSHSAETAQNEETMLITDGY